MSAPELSGALGRFVDRYMSTVDHVAVLLSLREPPPVARAPASIAAGARLDRDVVDGVLADLLKAHLVSEADHTFLFAPPSPLVAVIDELAQMYRTMPVTLIRAIYARPARAATSFADAFRLRGGAA